MQIRKASNLVNAIITNCIVVNPIIPSDIKQLREDAAELHKEMSNQNIHKFTVEQIMMLLLVEYLLGPYLDNQPETMNFFMERIAEESRVFDVDTFNFNPYIKNIIFENQQQGDFELRYHDLMPHELNIYDVPKRLEGVPVDIPRIGCFTKQFRYPVIFQRSIKSTWMSVSPNEVFTMEKPIKRAKGDVLTLGCGMGYFAYMASLKEEVHTITIVECEQNVIDLFETFILPQFEHKDKITIIKGDAIQYMNALEDGKYDYCFADIWIGVNDIQPYFAVKEVGRKFRKMKVEYWIEDSFAALLSNYVWIEILKSFSKASNLDIPAHENSLLSEEELRKAKYMRRLLENIEITKPEHIDYYMNPKNIIELIEGTDLVF